MSDAKSATNGVIKKNEAEIKVDSSRIMAPPATDTTSQIATQNAGTQSSDSSGKTSQSNHSSSTPSSSDTVQVAGSQEVTCESNELPNPAVWGIVHPLQPEFIQFELINDHYTFGRAKESNYSFDLPSIRKHKHHKAFSKMHFAIKRVVNPDDSTHTIFLEDLGGTNGTYVNGEKVPSNCQRPIQHLDKIALPYFWSNVFMLIDTKAKVNPDLPVAFSNKYILQKSIGKGACGEVFETWLKEGVGQFACKVVKKALMPMDSTNSVVRDAMTEAKLLLQLQHPCIIGINDVFDSPRHLYIVLEYAAGGELFQRLTDTGPLPEPLAKLYFYQMLLAVAYLHKNGITHRDLKPENILLMTSSEPTLIKITDFGMSRLVGEQSLMNTLAGTPSYLAPEILRGMNSPSSPGYTKLVDMWSLGVILYVCLVAYPPFSNGRNDTQQTVSRQILSANFNFNHSRWRQVSSLAKQLVSFLLKLEAAERLNTTEALKHEWFNDNDMRQKAAQLMAVHDAAESSCHTEVNINLMGEKSLSSESTSTRKVSNDADGVQLSDDALNKLSGQSSEKTESLKRVHGSSDVAQTKQAKLN